MNAQDLKNSILQLAVQGMLVEQRAEEGTARELLEQIKLEKDQLIKDKKIKKSKPLPEITEDEIPFEIPESWEWVRFDEFGNYKKGPFGSALTKAMFVPKGEDTVKVYEQKNAIQKDASLGDYYITRDYFESKMKGFELFPGDIIVSCAGTIGETYIMPEGTEQGIINQALMRMKLMPSVYVEYFLIYFDVILKQTARKSSKGSAIKNIPPFDELKRYLVPLPPLEEQHRIVAKIEEILPYIDQYDKAYTKLETFNKKFPEDMKKSILQMAMQGKLVEQRPEEGTADELYEQIVSEKAQRIKEGKIKKEKPIDFVLSDEIPWDLPENWKWVRFRDITINRDAERVPLSVSEREHLEKKYDYYGASGVIDKVDKYLFTEDLVLIGEDGANLLSRSTPIAFIATGKYWVNNHAHVIECCKGVFIKYFVYYINAISLAKYVTGTAQPKMNQARMNGIWIPLPPLEEQKRIVAKIEELLPYCDKLIKN